MLEETLARARASESMHANLKHQIAEHGKRNKELETTTNEAVLGRMKAESEYESIKSGMGSVSGWMKKEMEDLRGVLAEIQRQHGAEVLETRGKHQASSSALSCISLVLIEGIVGEQLWRYIQPDKQRNQNAQHS